MTARHLAHRQLSDIVGLIVLWLVRPCLEIGHLTLWLHARLGEVLRAAAWRVLVAPDDPALNQLDENTARLLGQVSGELRQIQSREVSQ